MILKIGSVNLALYQTNRVPLARIQEVLTLILTINNIPNKQPSKPNNQLAKLTTTYSAFKTQMNYEYVSRHSSVKKGTQNQQQMHYQQNNWEDRSHNARSLSNNQMEQMYQQQTPSRYQQNVDTVGRDHSGNNRQNYYNQPQNQYSKGGTGSTDDASFYAGTALEVQQNLYKPQTPLLQKQMPNQYNQYYREAIADQSGISNYTGISQNIRGHDQRQNHRVNHYSNISHASHGSQNQDMSSANISSVSYMNTNNNFYQPTPSRNNGTLKQTHFSHEQPIPEQHYSVTSAEPNDKINRYIQNLDSSILDKPVEQQIQTYQRILNEVSSNGGIEKEEAQILRSELESKQNMVLMIFKFFLQSKEYSFFVRRLKNVAATRTGMQPNAFGQQAPNHQHSLSTNLPAQPTEEKPTFFKQSNSSDYQSNSQAPQMTNKLDYKNYDSQNDRNSTFNTFLESNNSMLSGHPKQESTAPFSSYNLLNQNNQGIQKTMKQQPESYQGHFQARMYLDSQFSKDAPNSIATEGFKENLHPHVQPISPHSVKSSNRSITLGESAKKGEQNFLTPKLSAQDKIEIKRVQTGRATDSPNSKSDSKEREMLQGSPSKYSNSKWQSNFMKFNQAEEGQDFSKGDRAHQPIAQNNARIQHLRNQSNDGVLTSNTTATDLNTNQKYEKLATIDASPDRQQNSVSQLVMRKEQKSESTLSELLQSKPRRKDRDPSPLYGAGAQGTPVITNSYMPRPVTASSTNNAPIKQQFAQKTLQNRSKKRKTVLDQKDGFRLRATKCYTGGYAPEKFSATHILTWQDAISCLEDVGIDMTGHHESPRFHQPKDEYEPAKQVVMVEKIDSEDPATLQIDFYRQRSSTSQPQVNLDMKEQKFQQNQGQKTGKNFNNYQQTHEENVSSDQCDGGANIDCLSLNKSPSGNKQKPIEHYVSPRSQSGSNQKSARSARNILAPLENLRYSDLVYLLNILKLQRAKFEDQDNSRNKWISDIQLALSVAISGSKTNQQDSGLLTEMSNKIFDTVLGTAFGPKEQNRSLNELRYEHFIGPLVTICFASDQSNDQNSIVKLCFDQFERYYAKGVSQQNSEMREIKRSNSYTGKASSFQVHSIDCFLKFLTSAYQFIKANTRNSEKLIHALTHISYEKIQSNFLVFAEGSNHVLDEMDNLFGIQNPNVEPDSEFFYQGSSYSQLGGRVANQSEMQNARRQNSLFNFQMDQVRKSAAATHIGQGHSHHDDRREVNRSSISASDPSHPLSMELKNRPFSNLLQHQASKSQTRPKKGILKKQASSSFSKSKQKPVQFKSQNSQKLHAHDLLQHQRTTFKSQKANTEEFDERMMSRGAFTAQKDYSNNLMNRFETRDDLPKFQQSKQLFSPKYSNPEYQQVGPPAPRLGGESKAQQSSLQSLLQRQTQAQEQSQANVAASTLKYLRNQTMPGNLNYGKGAGQNTSNVLLQAQNIQNRTNFGTLQHTAYGGGHGQQASTGSGRSSNNIVSPGLNKNYNQMSTPRGSNSTAQQSTGGQKRSSSCNNGHGPKQVYTTGGVNYFKTLSGSSYKPSSGQSAKQIDRSNELNKTDPALNKSAVSQFSLTEQKQAQPPQNQPSPSRRQRPKNEIRRPSYDNQDLLGIEPHNDGRQDSSRSDDQGTHAHRSRFRIEDGQPKSAFLLQHMNAPSLTPKSQGGFMQFQGPPSTRYQGTVAREPRREENDDRSYERLTDFYRRKQSQAMPSTHLNE